MKGSLEVESTVWFAGDSCQCRNKVDSLRGWEICQKDKLIIGAVNTNKMRNE